MAKFERIDISDKLMILKIDNENLKDRLESYQYVVVGLSISLVFVIACLILIVSVRF